MVVKTPNDNNVMDIGAFVETSHAEEDQLAAIALDAVWQLWRVRPHCGPVPQPGHEGQGKGHESKVQERQRQGQGQ